MPTSTTIDEFELDIRLQDVQPEELQSEKYPDPTMPVVCTMTRYC
jgi:hypothetical protein